MELPITKPSQVSYADELEFSDLMEKMYEKSYDGFIRITHGSEEGYILFEDGQPVAASYDRFLKNEAVIKIEKAMEKSDSLIEVFDLKPSQISYLMDLNKAYKIEKEQPSPKLSSSDMEGDTNEDDLDYDDGLFNPKEASYRQPIAKIEAEERAEYDRKQEFSSKSEKQMPVNEPLVEAEVVKEPVVESVVEAEVVKEPVVESEPELDIDEIEEEEAIPIDREELMKKYGLKDIQEEEVDKVLDTYKGGTVSSSDLEKIELTLMNRIKQSVMAVPKIKGTEVMVFLENTRELGGKIKIISEYEGKGLFSRIMGESKVIENLKYQVLDIVEMEIRKSFREYPQIVENFDINIEIVH
ncbi:MAG: DUF2226 domain-containing protein [Methanobacteriaceae archaeon]|nr:DUF2226 domain-containing protein [Methanobacteriaceae archaeon]